VLDRVSLPTINGVDLPQELIDDWVFEATSGRVQYGPFAGMHMLRETSWREAVLAPMLLGTWEQELHAPLEREIARVMGLPDPKIAVIGCAEGYYAVGLARRVPHATVYAVDIDEQSCRVAAEAAELNGVDLVFGADISEVFAAPDLIVMDCEGAEVVYLDLEKFPALFKASIIVEVHNLVERPPAEPVLRHRFEICHRIDAVVEGARNPNIFPFLINTPSAFRWLCVSENRPCQMFWFVMTPRGE